MCNRGRMVGARKSPGGVERMARVPVVVLVLCSSSGAPKIGLLLNPGAGEIGRMLDPGAGDSGVVLDT